MIRATRVARGVFLGVTPILRAFSIFPCARQDTSAYAEAAKFEDGTDEDEQSEQEQGALYGAAIGLQERRRLTVASMSPEDIVS